MAQPGGRRIGPQDPVRERPFSATGAIGCEKEEGEVGYGGSEKKDLEGGMASMQT